MVGQVGEVPAKENHGKIGRPSQVKELILRQLEQDTL